jgi:ribose-phosphate pyrophosphokinase
MNIVGDVKGKDVIIVDDMIDTSGTLVEAAKTLRETWSWKNICFCYSWCLFRPSS